jgi:alkylation response protein AidB-like acyl-CoA dehydrogenase
VTGRGAVDAIGTSLPSVDPTRPVGTLDATQPTELPHEVDPARAAVGCAAEAIGVARRALDLGVEYVKTREQFGRSIGVYQAVAHPLATTFAEVELARSLVYWAAWSVDEVPAQTTLAASAAKAFATEIAILACERSIQVHGGIGFTWEHPLHRFYRRAQWLQAFGGYPATQRATVAATLMRHDVLPTIDRA